MARKMSTSRRLAMALGGVTILGTGAVLGTSNSFAADRSDGGAQKAIRKAKDACADNEGKLKAVENNEKFINEQANAAEVENRKEVLKNIAQQCKAADGQNNSKQAQNDQGATDDNSRGNGRSVLEENKKKADD